MPHRQEKESNSSSDTPVGLNAVQAEIADGANTLAALAAYSQMPSVANLLKMAAAACVQQAQTEDKHYSPDSIRIWPGR